MRAYGKDLAVMTHRYTRQDRGRRRSNRRQQNSCVDQPVDGSAKEKPQQGHRDRIPVSPLWGDWTKPLDTNANVVNRINAKNQTLVLVRDVNNLYLRMLVGCHSFIVENIGKKCRVCQAYYAEGGDRLSDSFFSVMCAQDIRFPVKPGSISF